MTGWYDKDPTGTLTPGLFVSEYQYNTTTHTWGQTLSYEMPDSGADVGTGIDFSGSSGNNGYITVTGPRPRRTWGNIHHRTK